MQGKQPICALSNGKNRLILFQTKEMFSRYGIFLDWQNSQTIFAG